MKRMLKLILVLVSIAVLGCSSSKDVVNIPGGEVERDTISVDFVVDTASYPDLDVAARPAYELWLKDESDPTSKPVLIDATQKRHLYRDREYTLSGYYTTTTPGGADMSFGADTFSLRAYKDIYRITVVRSKSRLRFVLP